MSFEALKKIFLLGLFVMSHNCQYFLGLIPTSVTLRTTLGETSACEQHDATVMDNNYNDNIIVIVSSNLAFSIQSSWKIIGVANAVLISIAVFITVSIKHSGTK